MTQFKINGQDDRRQLAAIFADNGYKVTINKKKVEGSYYREDHYLEVL